MKEAPNSLPNGSVFQQQFLRLLVFPGLGDGKRAAIMSAAVWVGLLLSRLMLLPNGPWEQDEAIFSTAVFEFDVPSHRPHPPGFPGWIGLGKVLNLVTGDPLLSLRLWSSLASVVSVNLLARLMEPLVGAGLALTGSIAYACAPLVWVHSPRAFSTTAAIGLALLALSLWRAPRSQLSALPSLMAWFFLGFAATVRPQLGPEFIVVGLVGLWVDRKRLHVALGGAGIAALTVGVVFGIALYSGGGVQAYWKATVEHLAHSGHASVLVQGPASERFLRSIASTAPSEWGIVRGVGGLRVALALAVVSAVGLARSAVDQRMVVLWLVLLLGVTWWMLFRTHSPKAPRYQVGLLLALAPTLMMAFRGVVRLGMLCFSVLAIVGGVESVSVLVAMQRVSLPPVAALRAIGKGHATSVTYEAGLFSFSRLASMDGTLGEVPAARWESATTPIPWGTMSLGLPTLLGPHLCSWTFDTFPSEAWELSQKRFTRVYVSHNPVLFGEGVYEPETFSGGKQSWLSPSAILRVPVPSQYLVLRLLVPGDESPQVMTVQSPRRDPIVRRMDGGIHTVAVPTGKCSDPCTIQLEFSHSWKAPNDPRTLTVRMISAWAVGKEIASDRAWFSEQAELPAWLSSAELYAYEGPHTAVEGRWLKPQSRVTLRDAQGAWVLRLRQPAHASSGGVTVETANQTQHLSLSADPQDVVVDLGSGRGSRHATIRLTSTGFVPHELDPRSSDRRELGLQLLSVYQLPARAGDCDALP